MVSKKFFLVLRSLLESFMLIVLVTSSWAASHETVLHSFNPHGSDGTSPQAGLISDAHGNLYGTTYYGGSDNVGVVFELTPNGSAGLTEKVLYNFKNDGTDGVNPYAGLVLDAAGNLYGTTTLGGAYNFGTVFELSPNGSGWTEKKLHNFGLYSNDGVLPYSGLIFDTAGNLFGTTYQGGASGLGTVFELSPNGSGGWTEKVLHGFEFSGTEGNQPYGAVIFDAAGNLYGTTSTGGDYRAGTVFELMPNGNGGWTSVKLHNFGNNNDGAKPLGSLIFDAAGDLCGTTSQGGAYNRGTVFELMPNGNGGWTEKKLHNLGSGNDGAHPNAELIFDQLGNLYGTTSGGGDHLGGTVFELTPHGSGAWTERKLRNFNNSGVEGAYPYAGLTLDHAGNLYSTTYSGGVFSGGTVFELSPGDDGGWIETVLYNFNFNGQDGANPFVGSLVSDAAGNLYGATAGGGAYNFGTVFELTPHGSGGWTEKVLHNFKGNNDDGGIPYGTLVFDAAGNLYGTTFNGGYPGDGTVFQLSPNGSGGWTETILHNFGNGADGAFPVAGVIFDRAGNLYGTTFHGGDYGRGSIFEMTPNGSGWTEKKLHNFNPSALDGRGPQGELIFDPLGNLYGTTTNGGDQDAGTVFELSSNGNGGWTEKKLHNFNFDRDGNFPQSALIFDGAGNLYGTTFSGPGGGFGTVFGLMPDGSGGWTERVLHNFSYGVDGLAPQGGLIFDAAGNLYGTDTNGGDHRAGTVFQMTPNGSGGWIETKLHNFFNNGTDGTYPSGSLILDHAGNLYGMTDTGGGHNFGTVFEVTP